MKWTDVKPSKPGWYWWRREMYWKMFEGVVEVIGPPLYVRGWGTLGECDEFNNSQWSDAPIAEPKDG